MGVKGFFNIFKGKPFKLSEIKGKVIGLDASHEIYRASLGANKIDILTNSAGTPTMMINIIFQNIIKYKKLGAIGIIYIFDNKTPVIKQEECNRRKQLQNKYVNDINPNKAKRAFSLNPVIIKDLKTLLTLSGVAWVVAPNGHEAEHLGAKLSTCGIIDYFFTGDSDALVFGSSNIVRRVPRGRGYEIFYLDSLLANHNIKISNLRRIAVILGCDFCGKTKGIGIKTVVKKEPLIRLDVKQLRAFEYFASDCPVLKQSIHKQNMDADKLAQWLIKENQFNSKRIISLIDKL